jgi:hypothetical protein
MAGREPSRSTIIATNLITFFLVLTAGFVLYSIGSGIRHAATGDGSIATHRWISIDRADPYPVDALETQSVPVVLRIDDASTGEIMYSIGRNAAPGILALGVLWFLRLIVRSVRDGDPFTAANVKHLRTIGFLLVIGVPVVEILTSAFDHALASSAFGSGSGRGIEISAGGPVAGLGVFVLAHVFAHGVRLRDDVEGTV